MVSGSTIYAEGLVWKGTHHGGAGFIGSHLAALLLGLDWEVFALDDLSTGSEANVAHLVGNPRFHLTVESVLSPSVVSELVHKCDVVFHLAAAVGVRLIVEQPGHTLLTNVRGTETILEYASRFEKPVLIASSGSSKLRWQASRWRSTATGRRRAASAMSATSRARWTA